MSKNSFYRFLLLIATASVLVGIMQLAISTASTAYAAPTLDSYPFSISCLSSSYNDKDHYLTCYDPSSANDSQTVLSNAVSFQCNRSSEESQQRISYYDCRTSLDSRTFTCFHSSSPGYQCLLSLIVICGNSTFNQDTPSYENCNTPPYNDDYRSYESTTTFYCTVRPVRMNDLTSYHSCTPKESLQLFTCASEDAAAFSCGLPQMFAKGRAEEHASQLASDQVCGFASTQLLCAALGKDDLDAFV